MKGKENEGSNRSNVILLTVIALVTMIVVVIGATFAYLAGAVGEGSSTVINATTEADSDMLMFEAGEALEIHADIVNFAEGKGDQVSRSYSSVLLQTNKAEGTSYDYNVYLEVPTNDFEYSSGKCYEKSAEAAIADINTAADCTSNNASNLWGTLDRSTYACYAATNQVARYDNEVLCTAAAKMWVPSEDAELVLDVYRSDSALTDEATCTAAGKCVDNKRAINADYTTIGTCSDAGYTWLANTYENDVCYVLDKTADLTEVKTVGDEVYQLYDNVNIAAVDGSTAHYYKTVVTLINFGHNQIVNGNKTFNGTLQFKRIVTGE